MRSCLTNQEHQNAIRGCHADAGRTWNNWDTVAVGRETPLSGNNAFPDVFRADTDTFWTPFTNLPDQALETVDQRSAAQLLVDTINQSPEPVEILMTGSATNIAEALTLDPSIAKKISRLQIMGGAVFVPGNLREHLDPVLKQNQVSEFTAIFR